VDQDSCVDVSSASGEGSGYTDTPLGWIGDEIIFERLNGDQQPVEFWSVSVDRSTLEPVGYTMLGGGDGDLESFIRPYPIDGGLLFPTYGAWIWIAQDGSVNEIDDNPYGGVITQIRISVPSGTLSYVAGGNLILAPIDAPGSAIFQVPFDDVDYSFAPDQSRIAVNTGDTIEIWDTQGNVLTTLPNPDGIAIGSLTWIDEGLVFVDASNGVLRIIQP
jgi:hypothetical protein